MHVSSGIKLYEKAYGRPGARRYRLQSGWAQYAVLTQRLIWNASNSAALKCNICKQIRTNYIKSTYSKHCSLTAVSNITVMWQGVNVHTIGLRQVICYQASGLLCISGIIAKGCAVSIAVVQPHRQGEWCIISILQTPGLACKLAKIADECGVWLSCDRCCSQMIFRKTLRTTSSIPWLQQHTESCHVI